MPVGVEPVAAVGQDALQPIALEGGLQRLLAHLHAHDEVLHACVLDVLGGVLHGAVQVVGGVQQVAGELLDGVGARVARLLLGPAAHVLGLGGVAHGLVLQGGVLRHQLGQGAAGIDGVLALGEIVVVVGHSALRSVRLGSGDRAAQPSSRRPSTRAV